MDEIYSDLDNYNDVNLVEELKNENKDLKFKLEEYSSSLNRLQKDFDKLSGEFKNLEKNYSSLLKTARAEIERKTETIKNLNIQKDKLVISSLQKGKNILPNRRGNFEDTQRNKNTDSKQNIRESTDNLENKFWVKRQPSVDTVASVPTDNQSTRNDNQKSKSISKNKFDSEERKDRDIKTHRNENFQEPLNINRVVERTKPTTIPECEPTFSSDDDSRKTITEQQYIQCSQKGEDVRQNEKYYDEPEHVMPENFDHYHHSSQHYRSRSNRHNDFERKRSYDNYKPYDQSRRYYGSDHYRYGKESENYNQRDYRGNKRDWRAERSPPPDRYNRAKSRDSRPNFERENYYDYNRYHKNNDNPVKTKFEPEEPSSKRVKLDSYGRHSNEKNFDRERDLSERHSYKNTPDIIDPSTCQSPDYTHIESNAHHSVKEIKHTALVPLQDPRLLSNKYILKSNSEKPALMTVAGSNVDIVFISNTTWGLDKNSKHFKQDNVMSVERRWSLESGEIESITETQPDLSILAKLKDDMAKSNSSNIVDKNPQTYIAVAKDVEKSKSAYKIPLLKKTHNIKEEHNVSKKLEEFGKDFKVIVEGKHLSEKSPENITKTTTTKTIASNTKTDKSKSILQKLFDTTMLSDISDHTKYPESNEIVAIRSTVEGDLELSDETSDNVDFIKKESKHEVREERDYSSTSKEIHINAEKDKEEANKLDEKVKTTKDLRKSTHSRKEKPREGMKTRRTKKQSVLEQTKLSKEKLPQIKENKEKEDKPVSNQTRNKFTDLFGDSNSLITPDDLGVSVMPQITPNKYVSIFENTQDAVDLNIEDINMVKAQRDNENTKVDEPNNKQAINDTTTTVKFESNKSNENENCNSNKPLAITKENKTEFKNDKNKFLSYYENAKLENSPNVVKTIILSTGTQPQCILKDTDEQKYTLPVTNVDHKQPDLQKGTLNAIKAVATSTPYKIESSQKYEPNECIKEIKQIDTPASTVGLNPSETITQNESDVPDVRIFVKRRKKITKRPV